MPDEVKLEPCPFCGKTPRIVCPDNSYGNAMVTCGDANECPVDLTAWGDLNDGETLETAIAAWNTRAAIEAPPCPELVERVARAMMAVSRPNANPDDLTPAPRGQTGSIPKWRLFEHLAIAAIEATRPTEATDVVKELAADIMAAMRRARLPKEYADEAHDEFEALTLVPMLRDVLTKARTGVTLNG